MVILDSSISCFIHHFLPHYGVWKLSSSNVELFYGFWIVHFLVYKNPKKGFSFGTMGHTQNRFPVEKNKPYWKSSFFFKPPYSIPISLSSFTFFLDACVVEYFSIRVDLSDWGMANQFFQDFQGMSILEFSKIRNNLWS